MIRAAERSADAAPLEGASTSSVRRITRVRLSVVVVVVVGAALALFRQPLAVVLPAAALSGIIGWSLGRRLSDVRAFLRPPAGERRSLVRTLGIAARLAVGAVAAWALINLALSPQIDTSRYGPGTTSGYNAPLAGLLVLAVLLSTPAIWRLCNRVNLGSPALKRGLAAAVVLTVVIQLAVGWGLTKLPDFDAGIIISSSYRQVFPMGSDHGAASYYYIALPNNVVLGYLVNLVAQLFAALHITSFAAFMTTLIWANCLILDLGALLTLVVARRLGGAALAAFLTPPVLLLIVFSPWLDTPYSDTIGLTTVIALLWLWLRGRETLGRRRLALFIVIGILAAFGSSIKPTVLALVAALLLIESLTDPPSWTARRWGALPRVLLTLAVIAAATRAMLVPIAVSHFVDFDLFSNKQAYPVTNFMVWGAHGTGGYNADDAQLNWQQPADQRFVFGLKRYIGLVGDWGPFGYLLFLGNKALWMLGDGSFYQGLEGDLGAEYLHSGPVSAAAQNLFALGGTDHVVIATLWQAAWIVALSFIALGIVIPQARRHDGSATAMRLALVLLFLFLLFAEGRSRYLYLYLPVVLLLGGLTVAATRDGLDRWKAALLQRIRVRPVDRTTPVPAGGETSAPIDIRSESPTR